MGTTRIKDHDRRTIVNEAAMSVMFDYFKSRSRNYASPLRVDESEADAIFPERKFSITLRNTVRDQCIRVLGKSRWENIATQKFLALCETTHALAQVQAHRWINKPHTRSLLVRLMVTDGGRFSLMSGKGHADGQWQENGGAWGAYADRENRTRLYRQEHYRFSTVEDAVAKARERANAVIEGSGSLDEWGVWDGLYQRMVFVLRRTDKREGNAVVIEDWTHTVVHIEPASAEAMSDDE